MSGYQEGGRRALDHVLAPEFLDGLGELSLDDLRDRRNVAEQEEADLSYARRLVQGRLDLLGAETQRRAGADGAVDVPAARTDAELVASLTDILADPRRSDHGSGRFTSVEPSRVGEHRRRAEAAVSDPRMSDVAAMDDAQLAVARDRLVELEQELSTDRHRVQVVMDACTDEISRRYREGAVDVDEVLRSAQG
ncbi:aerial mycelium formation protein [Kineococcus sp. R8]|uniref:RsiG family protein n=1 Tax=Kineococcus siccus TaxID=2696567 RepID=UPI0014131112|nr:aerial mycelium formation protein [Kineococcus siccus]NAZ81433.1 aerial mycelium formation protein [Kineococcus siccus]